MVFRTALYYTPPAGHQLARAAAHWLGRDAYGTAPANTAPLCGLDPVRWASLTAAPRRYGFHATLKAPFALAAGRRLDELDAALSEWCRTTPAPTVPGLRIALLDRFFALVPQTPSPELQRFAASVVRAFEPFRAPYSADELARRGAGLDATQQANLRDWGYPYIFDAFRFHMTLTGPVPESERPQLAARLERHFAAFVGQPLVLDAVALFIEPRPGAAFTVHSRHPLDGAGQAPEQP